MGTQFSTDTQSPAIRRENGFGTSLVDIKHELFFCYIEVQVEICTFLSFYFIFIKEYQLVFLFSILTSGEEPHLFFSFLLNSVRPSVRPFPPLPRPRSPCQSELICITAEHRRERRGDTADRATYMEMYEPEVRSELWLTRSGTPEPRVSWYVALLMMFFLIRLYPLSRRLVRLSCCPAVYSTTAFSFHWTHCKDKCPERKKEVTRFCCVCFSPPTSSQLLKEINDLLRQRTLLDSAPAHFTGAALFFSLHCVLQ